MGETVVVSGGDSGGEVAEAIEGVVEELGEVVSDAVEELTDTVEELAANEDEEPEVVAAPIPVAAPSPEIDYDRIVSGVADELERRERERNETVDETEDDGSSFEEDEPPEHGSFLYRKRVGH